MERLTRANHVRALMRQQRAVNGVRARLAECVGEAITTAAGDADVMTPAIGRKLKVGVERCLDTAYGARRGDNNAEFLNAILGSTAFAYTLAVNQSQDIAEKALRSRPTLLTLLKGYGRNRDG